MKKSLSDSNSLGSNNIENLEKSKIAESVDKAEG